MIIHFVKRLLKLTGKNSQKIKLSFLFAILESICQKIPIGLGAITIIKLKEQTLTTQDCLQLFIVLAISALLQIGFHYVNDQLQSDAGYRTLASLRIQLADHLRKVPMGYYTEGNIGKISSVLSSDMVFIEENVMQKIAQVANYAFNTLILLIFSFVLDYRLGLIVTLTLVVYNALIEKLATESLREGQIRQQQNQRLTDEVLFFLDGLAIFKSFNRLGASSTSLRKTFDKSKQVALEMENVFEKRMAKIYQLLALATALLLCTALSLYYLEAFPGESLIALALFYLGLFVPLKTLSGEVALFAIMDRCLDRVEELFKLAILDESGTKRLPLVQAQVPEIEFANVSFGYDQGTVLKDIQFKLPAATTTALVGLSGSGKSTIANLLTRFWDVSQGSIKIRGIEIKDLSLSELMDAISIVFQQTYLFEDTIYNNIKLGKQEATNEDVIEAAKKARCYEFIQALPNGFETVISEGGESLSGGQRQRISIARCILKDAPIVIFDEATASIDVDNEYYIQQAISELVKDKTLLMIAHRLNTIKSADKILVINQGQIVAEGQHDKLIAEQGLYASLYGENN